VAPADVAAGDRARDQVSAALDAVGEDLVRGPMQPLDALDDDTVGAGAADLRSHADEEVREIHDFGLARRILEHRFAVGERCRHHEVLGACHGDRLEHQSRAAQPPRARLDVAVLDVNVGAHRLQARHVDVHRAGSDGASAGERYVGGAEAREQGAEHQNRGAHGLHQLVGREMLLDARGVHLDAHLLVDRERDAHAAQQLDHGRDVLQMRHVRHRHRPVCQEAARENRQSGVLRARDADLALERNPAVNLQLIHERDRPPDLRTRPAYTPSRRARVSHCPSGRRASRIRAYAVAERANP
jgi:hypothetical protein